MATTRIRPAAAAIAVAAALAASPPEAPAQASSYLGVYALPRLATSVAGELVLYSGTDGPLSELRFEVSVGNEEGTLSVRLPGGLAACLDVELSLVGGAADELLDLAWGAERRYSTTGEPLTDEQENSAYLLAGTGLTADLVVRKAAGGSFEPGEYRLQLRIPAGAAVGPYGGPWTGRGGVGGADFRIARARFLPDRKRLLVQEANELLDKGEPAAAADKFLELVALDPADLASFAGLGEAQFRLPDYEAAAESFEKALPLVQQMGERSLVPERLAYCYLHQGRYEEAEQVLALTYTADAIPGVMQQLEQAMAEEGPPK
jgi:tetratricopeptide (TPR) repeat protein